MVGGGEGEGVIGEGDASPIRGTIAPVEIYLLDGLERHGGRVDGEDGGVPALPSVAAAGYWPGTMSAGDEAGRHCRMLLAVVAPCQYMSLATVMVSSMSMV